MCLADRKGLMYMSQETAYRINVKNPVYALLTEDNNTCCSYSEVKSFGESQEIAIAPKVITGSNYGNGTKVHEEVKLLSYDVTCQITKMNTWVCKDVLGQKYDNTGVLIENKDDKIPYIALGFEVELTEGHREVCWLVKGKAQPPSKTFKQREENISYGNDTIKFTFIPRTYDGDLRRIGDTSNGIFTDESADKFFETVPVEKVLEGKE